MFHDDHSIPGHRRIGEIVVSTDTAVETGDCEQADDGGDNERAEEAGRLSPLH